MSENKIIDQSIIQAGAKNFEFFYLRPKKMANQEAILRMRINKSWSGWKLKDGLVKSLGLEIGDTINTEVTVLECSGLIDEADDVDLFADGDGANWLLENGARKHSTIVAKVKFLYSLAPVGGIEGRDVWKLSLVFIEGYEVNQDKENNQVLHMPNVSIRDLQEILGE